VSAKREVYCKATLDAPHMKVRGSGRADVAIVDAVLVPINAPRSGAHEGAGVVVHTIIKGGFAVRFVNLNVSERTLLGVFVGHFLNGRASSAEGGRVKRKVGRLYK